MTISTRDLSELPEPAELLRVCKGLAMLDAILCEDWEFRYYSFNCKWSPGEMMGSMRNGEGDGYFVWFGDCGTAIKGTMREAPFDPYCNDGEIFPGVLDAVPEVFKERVVDEPAFTTEDTTFLIWRTKGDTGWKCGDVKEPPRVREYCENFLRGGADFDGSEHLLHLLSGDPRKYLQWATEYYELEDSDVELSESDVEHVLRLSPLTPELIARLGCRRDLHGLADDIEEIGFSSNG